MSNLFLSFSIAIGGAIGLVTLGKTLDFDFYVSKMLPLIPILYAITYEVLEHRRGGRAKVKIKTVPTLKDGEGTATAEAPAARGLTLERTITGVGVSFAIKFTVELCLVLLFLRYSGQSFSEAYGRFGFETVGAFLRGAHPWLSGSEGVYLLALIALLSCFGTGLWIGYTTKGNAILEGVITGSVISVIMSMTNMLVLYEKFEEVTERLADSLGYAIRAGFVIVIALQVLLYGLWSGLVQMGREERAERKVSKKFVRKPRK
jgi:hypothetical protein